MTPPSTDRLVFEARRLHELGYRITPLRGKKAFVDEWQHARLTLEEVRSHLEDGATTGIGHISCPEKAVLDFDGDSWAELYDYVIAEFPELESAPAVRTGSGRMHVHFACPGMGDSTSETFGQDGVAATVNLRGNRHNNALPPSIHPVTGRPYTWERDPEEHPLPAIPFERIHGFLTAWSGKSATTEEKPRFHAEETYTVGQRHDGLFKIACSLRAKGHNEPEILAMLLVVNQQRCKPPKDEGLVRDLAKDVVKRYPPGSTGEKGKKEKENAARDLCRLVEKFDLFHTPDGEPYARFKVAGLKASADGPDSPEFSGEHYETWPVRSRAVKDCLLRAFYFQHRKPPNAEALSSAVDFAAASARIDGEERAVYLRVAPREEGGFFLDLADVNWRAVEITESGWRLVSDPPVRFQRRSGMLALPEPERGGSVNGIRSYLNIGGEDAWRLALVWLTHAITTRGPFCVLALHGEQGAAKSTAARVLRCLVDPNKVELRSTPRDGRDLAITAEGSWVLAYDNLSELPRWLSDAFCRLATGSGFSTRELYSDRGEVLFDAMRAILFTGIEELATAGDLLDRSIVLTLPEIGEDDRIVEEDFWQAFNIDKPQLFGALLDVVSRALKVFPSSRPKRLQRMADFHRWGVAVEGALGWPAGSFTDAYIENRAAAVVLALEASLVCRVLLEWTRNLERNLEGGKEWKGTATALLEALERRAGDRAKKRDWPTHPAHLSGWLRRLAPALRRVGVAVTFERGKGKAGERLVTVVVDPEKVDKGPSEASERQTSDASDASDAPPRSSGGDKGPTEGGRNWGRWDQDRSERLRNTEYEARNGEI